MYINVCYRPDTVFSSFKACQQSNHRFQWNTTRLTRWEVKGSCEKQNKLHFVISQELLTQTGPLKLPLMMCTKRKIAVFQYHFTTLPAYIYCTNILHRAIKSTKRVVSSAFITDIINASGGGLLSKLLQWWGVFLILENMWTIDVAAVMWETHTAPPSVKSARHGNHHSTYSSVNRTVQLSSWNEHDCVDINKLPKTNIMLLKLLKIKHVINR